MMMQDASFQVPPNVV